MEDAPSLQRILQTVEELQLLLRSQHEHLLQQLKMIILVSHHPDLNSVSISDLSGSGDVYKTVDVDIDESCHQELAVESVHDASVTRDDVTEVLNFKCSLESRGEEASEGADDGGEQRHEEAVDEEGVEGDGLLHVEEPPPGGDGLGEGVLGGPEVEL